MKMLLSLVPVEKQCTRCSKIKLLKEFPPHTTGRFGLYPKCIECCRISVREYQNTFNGFLLNFYVLLVVTQNGNYLATE